jgi:fructokinase
MESVFNREGSLMTTRIAVIGEALTDCVQRSDTADIAEVPGGSPMNVAIGLGRLGHDVVLAARWGQDDRGMAIASHVGDSQVKVIDQADGLERTSTATAVIQADGSAEYVFDLAWDITPEMVKTGGYAHVHTGSIAATLEPGAQAVWDIVAREREAGASVSYDPNARPQIMGTKEQALPRVEAMIDISDIVKASDEDLDWFYPGRSSEEVVSDWLSRGVALVIITRGKEGLVAYSHQASVVLPTRATTVVDTIGAGDSVMSGIISALATRSLLGASAVAELRQLDEAALSDIVGFALDCAAHTVSQAGANSPWLTDLT